MSKWKNDLPVLGGSKNTLPVLGGEIGFGPGYLELWMEQVKFLEENGMEEALKCLRNPLNHEQFTPVDWSEAEADLIILEEYSTPRPRKRKGYGRYWSRTDHKCWKRYRRHQWR